MRRLAVLFLIFSIIPITAYYVVGLLVSASKIDFFGALPIVVFAGVTIPIAINLRRKLVALNVSHVASWGLVWAFVLLWIPFLSWTLFKFICMQLSGECL